MLKIVKGKSILLIVDREDTANGVEDVKDC